MVVKLFTTLCLIRFFHAKKAGGYIFQILLYVLLVRLRLRNVLCIYYKNVSSFSPSAFDTFLSMQVSTSTGVKSHYFNLHVMVPTAFILGSDEYHTQAGNAISLVCIIENVSDFPPSENT